MAAQHSRDNVGGWGEGAVTGSKQSTAQQSEQQAEKRTLCSLNLVRCSTNQLGAASPLPVFPAGDPAPLPQHMRCFQPRCGPCSVPGSSTSTLPTTRPAAGGSESLCFLLPSTTLCPLSKLLSLSLLPCSSLSLALLTSPVKISAPAQKAAAAATGSVKTVVHSDSIPTQRCSTANCHLLWLSARCSLAHLLRA